MKILFYGDSITDMGRNKEDQSPSNIFSYGSGYPMFVAGELYGRNPLDYQVINRGISGNRIVDLYARIKKDVWNLEPDVLSILVGINDIWHEINFSNGVDIERFERTYRTLIEDTKKRFPNLKIVLCEPFVLEGARTENVEEIPDRYNRFLEIYDYAKVIKKIAKDYNLFFLPLQEKFNEQSSKYGVEPYLYDGVHPMVAGAKLIADNWIELFDKEINK